DTVFGDEPDLKLVAPNHVAHEQVVCAVVSAFGRAPSHRARLLQDDFVSVEQPRNLDRCFLTAFWRSRNQRSFGRVMSHGEAHAAERLNAFSDLVDKLVLLLVMLVEEQM